MYVSNIHRYIFVKPYWRPVIIILGKQSQTFLSKCGTNLTRLESANSKRGNVLDMFLYGQDVLLSLYNGSYNE